MELEYNHTRHLQLKEIVQQKKGELEEAIKVEQEEAMKLQRMSVQEDQ
jgi:hypothetical protein